MFIISVLYVLSQRFPTWFVVSITIVSGFIYLYLKLKLKLSVISIIEAAISDNFSSKKAPRVEKLWKPLFYHIVDGCVCKITKFVTFVYLITM